MEHSNRLPTIAAAALLAAGILSPSLGCDAPPDDLDLHAVDGLEVRSYDSDGVVGTFTVDGATIEFSLERDTGTRTALITDDDGEPLLESIAEPGHEVVTLFGGRAVLSGNPGEAPQVEGDETAHDELVGRPEGRAIAGLHAALEEAGVEPSLLGVPDEDAETPRLYYDGSYWNLSPNESYVVGTWGWLTYTHIGMRIGNAVSGPPLLWGCVEFQAGFAPWDYVCGPSGKENLQARQFWGAILTIHNYQTSHVMRVRTY